MLERFLSPVNVKPLYAPGFEPRPAPCGMAEKREYACRANPGILHRTGARSMKSAWLLLVALGSAALGVSARAQGLDFGRIEIATDQIAPNLYMLSGSAGLDPAHEDAAGGRIGVLAGPDGILMVDAQYGELADKVLAAIRRISAAPVRLPGQHPSPRDHTGGNANYREEGASLLAREELRRTWLRAPHSTATGFRRATQPASQSSPTAWATQLRFRMNGEVVDLIPIRAAHTGGDTIDPFRERRRHHDRRLSTAITATPSSTSTTAAVSRARWRRSMPP